MVENTEVEETEPEPEAEAEAEEDKEKEDEEESEEEAQKEPDEVQDEVEMNAANEIEEEVETEARVEAEKVVEEEVKEPEEEDEKMVEEEVEEPEEEGEKMVEEDEEKQEFYMVVYEGSTCETKEADKGAAKPSGTGVKHRPKQMALRKHATKQAPKPRGRLRKDTEPKKFTTPEQTKRIRSRSQWVSTPFTEANTDEIEGRKKKPRTKA
uniref:Uncharacterized protein n=1 Tax=Brassica oleracea TaxID=3712 RepID=A0A3P6DLE1_BRAOL|nr:unnamed protein product [Brassica oleracea]